MRIKKRYGYNGGKSFVAWELTVGQYYLFLRDSELCIEQLLSEFGELPQLNMKQLNAFLDDIFENDDPLRSLYSDHKKNKEEMKHLELDFHLNYVRASKICGFDIKDMPLKIYRRIIADSWVIADPEKYDKDRHKRTPDKRGFGEIQGHTGVLHNKSKK